MKSSRLLTLVTSAWLILLASPATARNFDLFVDNITDDLVPIDQQLPQYPNRGVRSGQEGWVLVSYVVTEAGTAIHPIVVDSVGGAEFEQSVRDAVATWTFEPTGELRTNVSSEVRFEIYRGRDAATSNFLRRYRRIVQHLFNEENEEAREALDATIELGGWNLYESTMLWLMIGRVEGAEGDDVSKLEAYRRALAVATPRSLTGADRLDLLRMTFELEMGQSQYAAAHNTLEELRRRSDDPSSLDDLAELIAELDQQLSGDAPIAARATISSAADPQNSIPLWSYVPARRTFSFAAFDGNVERFEARCERDRLEGAVEAGKAWTLPDGATDCRVFVFGDDGASFDFVEHIESESSDATAGAAVAHSNGMDR